MSIAPMAAHETKSSVPLMSRNPGLSSGARVISSIMNCQSRLKSTTPAKLGSLAISMLQKSTVAALHLVGGVVYEQRNFCGRADLRKVLDRHRRRRRPVVGRGHDDGRSPCLTRVARERRRRGGAGIADVRNHRGAALHMRDGELDQPAALAIGETHRLARMHGQRQRLRAVRELEINQPAIERKIDCAVARKRRYGSLSRMPSRSS